MAREDLQLYLSTNYKNEITGQVIKNGQLYEAATLEAVWLDKRQLPDQWFSHLGPSAP